MYDGVEGVVEGRTVFFKGDQCVGYSELCQSPAYAWQFRTHCIGEDDEQVGHFVADCF